METAYLSDDEFWVSAKSVVIENPRDPDACAEANVIRGWIADQVVLSSHLLFRTSGSTGRGKWVALSKAALLASAEAVNEFLGITKSDRWLQTLPLFHVGGVGILVRAHLAGCEVSKLQSKWDVVQCHRQLIDGGITFISLVPTQLADIVRGGMEAPNTLRAVLVGGGRLSDSLYQQAVNLGWPIVETYGMTETSSQVATTHVGERELRILPCWKVKSAASGGLLIKGQPLLSGYVGVDKRGLCFLDDPKQNGWFATSDLVNVQGGILSVQGRVDRCVKILGELINLEEVERKIAVVMKKFSHSVEVFSVVALEDGRGSHRLVLGSEKKELLQEILESYHQNCHPLHRIDQTICLRSIPRTGIGKIDYAQLTELLSHTNLR